MASIVYPKIALTGDLGSGKSTVSKILKDTLSFELYSTGKMQREIAAKYKMSTLELNKYAETHPEIDTEIDNFSKLLGEREESLIIDSRLAWFFIPHSFKIYLKVDPVVAVSRIMSDTGRKSETYVDADAAKRDIHKRKQLENERFMLLYKADCGQMKNFDLVVDTTEMTREAVAQLLISAFRAWPHSH